MEVHDRYSVCEDWLVKSLNVDEERLEKRRSDKSIDHAFRSAICEAFEDAMRASHFKFNEGAVYAYDGRIYRKTSPNILGSVIGDVMRRKKFPPLYRVESRKPIIEHCVGMLQRKKFRPDKNLIAFRNCVYDLSIGEPMPHSADLNVTTYLDFEYDAKAKCPLWMKFLTEVLQSDEKIRMVQEYLGCAFVDRRKYKVEHMMFLIGSGQNGKGVLTNTISELFGLNALSDDDEKYEGMISTFSPQELFREGNREYKISAINGKLLNICEDMSNQDFSGGDFKKASSGEPMSARDPYGQPYVATQIPLFIASLNEFPRHLQDRSDGNYRRYWIVEFNVKISDSQRDPELKHKLLTEKSGIFNWIVEGYLRVIRNGGKLTESEDNKQAVRRLRIQQDSRLQWLQDKGYQPTIYKGAERMEHSLKNLYEDYCKYCKDNNYNSFGNQEFAKRLSQEGYESKRRADGMYYWVYYGGEYEYEQPISTDPVPGQTATIQFPEEDDGLPF